MKLHIFPKAYYLKKLQKGQLTKEEVAYFYDTTVEVVEEALSEYNKEKNPFTKKSFEFKYAIIQSIISIVSAILVLLTLFEMQAARNATYMPDISFGKTEVAISWDKNGTVYNIDEEIDEILLRVKKEDTNINSFAEIKIYNIGVGTAKNIDIVWDHKTNIDCFIEALTPYDDIEITYKNGMVYTKTKTIESGTGILEENKLDYMLSSTKEYSTVLLPIPYTDLIRELFIRNTDNQEIPSLFLDIHYSDVQGKRYSKQIKLNIQIAYYLEKPDGSGCCTYNIIAAEEKKVMSKSFMSNLDADTITAIIAVIISFLSIVLTLIFSICQVRHNKNSVRPISSIKVNDYENKISVKIHNAGTGPLLVKRLVLKNDIKESSSLISMMPQINQPWATFTESIDGWTIPVGGKINLLELYPESEDVKRIIRKELAKITIVLDYTDIYKTKFHDSRKLDFFARHYN